MQKLFSEFAETSARQWKEQIISDLKGGEFEKLLWPNSNGFTVDPFYTSESLSAAYKPLFSHSSWEICEEIDVSGEKEANQKALLALNAGAGSLRFVLRKRPDINVLLDKISIQHIELNFILEYSDPEFLNVFHSYVDSRGVAGHQLTGHVSADSIANLVAKGSWLNSEKDIFNNNTSVNGTIYHNAGATQSVELACVLAHAHEYLVHLKQKKKFRFAIAVGPDFFGEMAKLRALRKLWSMVAAEYKTQAEIHIHAQSSAVYMPAMDAYNNMLRSTTEGMSAVLGGCNSLTLDAYNKSFEPTNAFGERIARNQQLILKEESYLDKIADAGAGSYYIEWLTDQIAETAWREFKEIESRGGFIACLRSNYIQDKIQSDANKLVNSFRETTTVLIGVNKFQNKNETVKNRPCVEDKNTGNFVTTIKAINLADFLVKENA